MMGVFLCFPPSDIFVQDNNHFLDSEGVGVITEQKEGGHWIRSCQPQMSHEESTLL